MKKRVARRKRSVIMRIVGGAKRTAGRKATAMQKSLTLGELSAKVDCKLESYMPINGNRSECEIEEDLGSYVRNAIKHLTPIVPSGRQVKKHSVASMNTMAKDWEKQARKLREEVRMKRAALKRLEKAHNAVKVLTEQLIVVNGEIDKKYKR